jgi:PPOX class probable FMN-dependent enzyme
MELVHSTRRIGFRDVVHSLDELVEVYGGGPSALVQNKIIDRLDGHCRDFIARSPFFLLATSSGDGRCDVSPRGGPPGFVEVLDEQRLAFADAKGNRLLDSLRNIVMTGRAGLLFVIPGLEETLRVNGRASITHDPEILARHEVEEGRPPRLAVGIEVEEVFLHCAKAFIRSALWQPEAWPSRDGLARPARIWKDHAKLVTTSVEELEASLAHEYANDLYWEPADAPADAAR